MHSCTSLKKDFCGLPGVFFYRGRAHTTYRFWRVIPQRKRDCKFDISNASSGSEQIEVLLSGTIISSGGLVTTLLVAVWKNKKTGIKKA